MHCRRRGRPGAPSLQNRDSRTADTITGTFNQATGKATIIAAFALKGGTIEARFQGTATSFRGRILNGTGKYAGISGTATAKSPTQNSPITHVTLRYS
jgi:hypothetical protein